MRSNSTHLRYLFWGGDALSHTLYEQISIIAPNAVSVNFYGTTETPQAMAYHHVDPEADNARIPLGKGIEGAQLLIVNEPVNWSAKERSEKSLYAAPICHRVTGGISRKPGKSLW